MKEAEAKEALELALEFEAKPSLDEMIAQVSADYWTVVGGQHARLLEDMINKFVGSRSIRRWKRSCARSKTIRRR